MKKHRWWAGKEDLFRKKYAPCREIDYGGVAEIYSSIDLVSSATTGAEINQAFVKFCNRYGFTCGGHITVANGHANEFVASSQIDFETEEYVDLYIKEKLIEIDAYRFFASESIYPVPFGLPHHMKFESKEERKYASTRKDFGGLRGVQLTHQTPLGYCTIGIGVADNEKDFLLRLPNIAAQVQIFGIALYDALRRVTPAFNRPFLDKHAINLTRREIECLHWAAAGKTAWETSCILSIAERTVFVHMDNAKKKLDAKTLPQAVATAVMLGVISL